MKTKSYSFLFAGLLALNGCVAADLGGDDGTDKIVGGTNADISEFPWQISMQTQQGFPFCGGSILDEQFILTASHCVDGSSASSMRIAAGITRVSTSGSVGQLRNVAEIIMAPGYSSPEFGKDVALLRLSQPLDLSGPNATAIDIVTAADAAAGVTAPGVNATVTGWGTLSSGGNTPDVLQQVTVPLDQFQHFVLEVPAGATNLSFVTSGGTGDADLYVRLGSQPTEQAFDCRPFRSGNNERCDFANPTPGTYFVSLHAFSAFSGVTLVGSFTGGSTEPGFPGIELERNNLSGSRGQFVRFELAVPEGAEKVTFQISGGSGDADLYVRRGSEPTTSAFDCRPFLNGNNETCTFNNPVAGTYFIGVRGFSAFSGVNLIGDIE